jgi:hypothetical protein
MIRTDISMAPEILLKSVGCIKKINLPVLVYEAIMPPALVKSPIAIE